MNRRSFLRGLFAAPAIVAVESLMPIRAFLPVIWGDGIHDDTAGLMALVNNDPVSIIANGTKRVGDQVLLGAGNFRVAGNLDFRRSAPFWLQGGASASRLIVNPGFVLTLPADGSASELWIEGTPLDASGSLDIASNR